MTSSEQPSRQTSRKPFGIKPPSRLSRAERACFWSLLEEFTTGYNAISQILVEEVADLVQARTRVATLNRFLNGELRESREYGGVLRNDVLSLCRAIESATALAMKLADRVEAKNK